MQGVQYVIHEIGLTYLFLFLNINDNIFEKKNFHMVFAITPRFPWTNELFTFLCLFMQLC